MASSKMSTADQKALQELTADMQKVAFNTTSSSSAVNVTSESEWELTKSDSEVGKMTQPIHPIRRQILPIQLNLLKRRLIICP